MARSDLPSGTVTFLFTDVEGSTKLLHALGADAYADALAEHRGHLRAAFAAHGGVEVDTQGDAFFAAFPTARGALAAALEATDALAAGPIRVRVGLHTGTPLLTDEGYVGADVHKGARIAAAGHGGQVLVSSTTAPLLDGAQLRDLGAHRLKDLTAPERIFQADADDHPPLRTLHQTNLPIPATPFLGRQADLDALGALLARDEVRLVTLTGTGGTGKTRLALQAAADAAEAYPDGVWWVPLAALRDPELVIGSAARALGASGELREHIGDKRLLLLLDNFEHLLGAAEQLAPLLAACPNLTLLVTSREPLHLAGEHEYSVDPLDPADAVALFLGRAAAVRRDVAPGEEIGQLCARLDHLPLAIELAAARVKMLAPRALLERLERRLPMLTGGARDAPERQRTLRATIEWSHELLDPDEQRLFRRMAVFRGGATLEAAEAVADADLDTLGSLVDKSLVRVRIDERFWMLETIREFAVEQLEASGEADALRARHAEVFLALAEEAEPHVRTDDRAWLDRLEADHDNLRAAHDRLMESGPAGDAQRLAAALWRFWYLHTHFREGLRRLTASADLDDASGAARASILRGSGVMALNLGDTAAARGYAEAARELDTALGDEWGVAYSTMMLGNALSEARDESRDLPRALAFYVEAVERFERIGDRHYGLIALNNQAWIIGELGDQEAEDRLHLEALRIAREVGNEAIEADALAQVGMAARDAGQYDEAADLLRQAIRIDRRLGMTSNVATSLGRLASVAMGAGDAVRAAVLLGAEEAEVDRIGAELSWWAKRRAGEVRSQIRVALGEPEADAAEARGRAMSLDEAVALAIDEA